MQAKPEMNPSVRRIAAALFAASATLAGCGGDDDAAPPAPAPAPAPAPNITPAAGGTVTSADGRVQIVVPPGAASAPMTLAIVPSSAAFPGDVGFAADSGYDLTGGGTLGAEAEVRMTVDVAGSTPAPLASKQNAIARKQAIYIAGPNDPPSIECMDANGAVTTHVNGAPMPDVCIAPPKIAALSGPANAPVIAKLGNCVLLNLAQLNLVCRTTNLKDRLAILFDKTPPTATLAVSQTTFTAPGTLTVTLNANDNRKLLYTKVIAARRDSDGLLAAVPGLEKTKYENSMPTPATLTYTYPISSAQNGEIEFIGVAGDANLNIAVDPPGFLQGNTGIKVMVNIPVAAPDTTPPVVSLASSTAMAQVGQTATLTATATDNVGVALVEFYRGASKVGESAASPFSYTTPAFVAGDVGSITYTARAYDTAGNSATSGAVTVTVSNVAATEAYVNATSGSDVNPGTSAAPFKTLDKAFTTVGAGGTVWLQNGAFTAATEGVANIFTGRTLPANVNLRAVNAGGASIGFTLTVPAGATIRGLDFDVSSVGRVLATGGTVTVSRPQWIKNGVTTLGAGIDASGTARVFVDPDGLATHNYVGAAGGLTGFAAVADSAELTVNGGVIDGSTGQATAFTLDGTAKLTLNNVAIRNTPAVWVGGLAAVYVGGTSNTVALNGVEIDLANAGAPCLVVDRQVAGAVTSQVTITGSTLKRCGGGGMQLREGTPTLAIVNSTIADNGIYGIWAGQIGFDSGTLYGRPTLTLTNTNISGHPQGGISFNNGGTLAINGGAITGSNGDAIGLLTAKPYTLTLRNATLSHADALQLEGDAASSFDLGTSASPGNNTLNASTTGVRVSVAADITVLASGNTWKASQQGADAQGKYSLASAACGGANPCDVGSGNGANYTFANAGANAKLRLAP